MINDYNIADELVLRFIKFFNAHTIRVAEVDENQFKDIEQKCLDDTKFKSRTLMGRGSREDTDVSLAQRNIIKKKYFCPFPKNEEGTLAKQLLHEVVYAPGGTDVVVYSPRLDKEKDKGYFQGMYFGRQSK
jgi:hypothetical protein